MRTLCATYSTLGASVNTKTSSAVSLVLTTIASMVIAANRRFAGIIPEANNKEETREVYV